MQEKTLNNSDVKQARKQVPDLQVFGDGDLFKLISKASSEAEGWMKATKAMDIPGVGCLVQVTTQQRNPDGSYALAEALTFVPGVEVRVTELDQSEPGKAIVKGRCLQKVSPPPEGTRGLE